MKLVVPSLTLQEFAGIYIERYAKPRKKSWYKDRRYLDSNILPVLGHMELSGIDSTHVAKLHADIGQRAPVEANRTIEILKMVFTCAINWGEVPRTFANPVVGIQKFKERTKTRWLTEIELEQLAKILKRCKAHHRVFCWMLILTGARSSEIKFLRWTDVDFRNSCIYFEETKNGDPHSLPVSSQALALLASLPRKGDYVFPPCRYDVQWRKIRKQVPSLRDVRLHDYRHTTASRLLQQGHSLRLVGDVLNHRSLEATNRYAHLGREHLRRPLNELASKLPLPREAFLTFDIDELENRTNRASGITSEVRYEGDDLSHISAKSGTVEKVPGTTGLHIRHNHYFSVYYANYYALKGDKRVHVHETIGRVDQITEAEARKACERIIAEKKAPPRTARLRSRTSYEWDGDVPGFGVRHNLTVSSWVATYRDSEKQRFITLGRVDHIPRLTAKETARKLRYCDSHQKALELVENMRQECAR